MREGGARLLVPRFSKYFSNYDPIFLFFDAKVDFMQLPPSEIP
jgi:hypothetical protein